MILGSVGDGFCLHLANSYRINVSGVCNSFVKNLLYYIPNFTVFVFPYLSSRRFPENGYNKFSVSR